MAAWTSIALSALLFAQSPPAAAPPDATTDDRAPWTEVDVDEHGVVRGMLESPDWPFRAMALARLDRYSGDEVEALVTTSFADESWQVRCFAVRQAQSLGMEVAPDAWANETDARVLRALLRSGFSIPTEQLDPIATKLLATKTIDDLMLGIELAAFSSTAKVREDAGERLTRMIRNMDDSLAALVGGRLTRVLDLPKQPETAEEFRALLQTRGGEATLPSLLPGTVAPPAGFAKRSMLADMSHEQFARLRDYLGALRQRDLDLVLVMDATSSMIPMINEAKAGADALILFMNELSRTMRLALIAYRDHDNAPVWEGERFTNNINTIREFLFKLRITGGADLPEAVYDGVAACRDLNWRNDATRIIVLIGDAPPHADDESKLFRELEWHEQCGTVVHTLHVPMRYPDGYLERMPAQQAAQMQLENEKYNESTREKFSQIAAKTRGQSAVVNAAAELVPAVMHCTIEPQWHEAFDEFYRLYLELCR